MSIATIARWTSEPREDFLPRADEKRACDWVLCAKGLSVRAIAAETGYSVGTAHRYAKEDEVA